MQERCFPCARCAEYFKAHPVGIHKPVRRFFDRFDYHRRNIRNFARLRTLERKQVRYSFRNLRFPHVDFKRPRYTRP